MFRGRNLIIATKHKKEAVISPLIEKKLGVKCIVPDGFDSDIFGTFTGEIDRVNDPVSTARDKCLEAMALFNCDLGIASEGSFGPHPSLYLIPADDEILMFIDKKNNLEIIAREISNETNFNGRISKMKSNYKILQIKLNFHRMLSLPKNQKMIFPILKKEFIHGIDSWKYMTILCQITILFIWKQICVPYIIQPE